MGYPTSIARYVLVLIAVLLAGAGASWCADPAPTDRAVDVRRALRAARDTLEHTRQSVAVLEAQLAQAAQEQAEALHRQDERQRQRRAAPLPPRPSPATPDSTALVAWRSRAETLAVRLTDAEDQVDSLRGAVRRNLQSFREAQEVAHRAMLGLQIAQGSLSQANDDVKSLVAERDHFRARAERFGLGIGAGAALVVGASPCVGPGAVAGVRTKVLGPLGVVVGYGAALCGQHLEHGPAVVAGLNVIS